jgi:hypothetical protein
VKKKRRRTPSPFAVGDDLGVDWSRWADGRPFRLKRKRDYPDANPDAVRADVTEAARRMGKVVVAVRDRYVPHKYVWVQFADHKVATGNPCPCGSERLLRVHANFLRCPQCNAQLLLSDEPDEEERKESRAVRKLRELTEVHLERRGATGDLESYRGYAWNQGAPVLVWADFRRKPWEDRIDQKHVFDRVAALRTIPFAELTELFDADHPDVSSLWNGQEPEWDFVWEGGEEREAEPLNDLD